MATNQYTTPRITTPEEYDLPIAELRDWALDTSADMIDRVIAAAKLAAMGEPVCATCADSRVIVDNCGWGEPWNAIDAPCPDCNADGRADEGEPVVEVPPALLPSLCGFGALVMDVAALAEVA